MTEFSNLGLSAATLEAVAATGYTEATPIQAEAIPVAPSIAATATNVRNLPPMASLPDFS